MKLSKELEYWRAERPDEWKMEEFLRQAKGLEQENAKLKSKLANIEKGINNLDDTLILNKHTDAFIQYRDGSICLISDAYSDPEYIIESSATLKELINNLLTGGK